MTIFDWIAKVKYMSDKQIDINHQVQNGENNGFAVF